MVLARHHLLDDPMASMLVEAGAEVEILIFVGLITSFRSTLREIRIEQIRRERPLCILLPQPTTPR